MLTTRQHINLILGAASFAFMQLTSGIGHIGNHSTVNLSSIDLGFNLPAFAGQTNINYQPPDRGKPRQTEGTGSRGCPDSEPVSLTLLVPNDHTGLTTSGRPNFYWHLSGKTAMPIEIALVEPGIANPLFVKQIEVKEAGLVQLDMPPEAPELMPGHKYRWSVTMICNTLQRSQDVFAQAWIERVAVPGAVEKQLAGAKSDSERARIYAEGGLWYDAIAAISSAIEASPNNQELLKERVVLLQQIGVAKGGD